jgi:hypothetical protein
MIPNLRAIDTVGIDLGHGERLIDRQFRRVRRMGFHDAQSSTG